MLKTEKMIATKAQSHEVVSEERPVLSKIIYY